MLPIQLSAFYIDTHQSTLLFKEKEKSLLLKMQHDNTEINLSFMQISIKKKFNNLFCFTELYMYNILYIH